MKFKKMTHAWVWLVYFWNWNLKPRNLCHCLLLAFLSLLFIYIPMLSRYFFFLAFFIHAHRVDTGRIENSFSYLLCPINTYQATRLDLCIAYPIWFPPCLSITFGLKSHSRCASFLSIAMVTYLDTGYSFLDRLRNFLHRFTWIVLRVHKLNKLSKFW